MALTDRIAKVGYGYGVRPLDRRLGSLSVGNPNGLLPTVAGRASIELSRLRSDYRPDEREETPDVEEAVADLRTKGYAHLGQLFDESLVEAVHAKFDEVISNDELLDDVSDLYDEEYIRSMSGDLLQHVPEFAQFIDPYVQRVLRRYYGSYVQVRECYGYRNFHVPEDVSDDVYANHWHIDPTTTDHLKLFVNLTDVDDDHGPLHVVPKADTKRLARKTILWNRDRDGMPHRLVEPEATTVERLTGPKGTAMIANTTRTLHRAGVPAEGKTRDFFQFVVAPSSKPLPHNWEAEELPGVTYEHVRRPLRY